jgi:anti-sigma factor ChrR (cupin superfamily)
MTEIFNREAADENKLPLSLPISGSVYMNRDPFTFQETGTPGFNIKPLYENPDAQQRTWLMEVEAGASCESHSHQELEQVYVLSGSFYDEEHTYYPGEFILRAPGAMHTAGSQDGATVLLVYCKAT